MQLQLLWTAQTQIPLSEFTWAGGGMQGFLRGKEEVEFFKAEVVRSFAGKGGGNELFFAIIGGVLFPLI